jgi:pyruvate,water dikinase
MDRYILSFREVGKEDVPVAGGKGANLGEMVSAGIPVPAGGVLTARAYGAFLRENGIDVGKMLRESGTEQDAAERIQRAVMSGRLPADIERELRQFYGSLGEGARVAVRSSATAEDLADASFAGQQETYLNVTSAEELLDKIKACYASLWSMRAIHYRGASGYADTEVSLAVVIQEMVESEAAGVLFTKDPAGGGDEILINASYGLGEAVVSGLVSPDEYLCTREGEVKKAVIGSKELQIVYGGRGTVRIAVDEERRRSRVLCDAAVRSLVDAALAIEAHYGRPMDVEWAMRGGRVYILQARYITTLAGPERAFTDADFAGLPAVRPAAGRLRENVLFNLEKLPKPYLPLDHDFGDAVGRQKQVVLEELGVRMNEMTPIDDDGISSFSISGMRLTRDVIKLPAQIRRMKDEAYNIKKSAEELAQCRAACEEERNRSHSSVREIGDGLERLRGLISRTAYARFRYAVFPQVLENASLDKTLARVDRALNAFDLMEGLSYVTADVNREMARMAADVRKDAALTAAVMTCGYERLVSEHPELKERFGGFMEAYGNRSDFNCYCFAAKSWNEEPDRFLHSFRTVLRSGDAGMMTAEESGRKFDALMERVRQSIGERRYAGFEKKVNAVRRYHYVREATQYLWESEFALCRRLLRGAAELLGTSYEDLLYLFADELFAVCKAGRVDAEAAGRIRRRKDKRPLALAYWERSIATMLGTGNAEIKGIPGSAGKAAGRACIVRTPGEFDKLREGDILICPYTDPEWTPLFTLAAGVVADTGGTLSHAAIVAREYGIPAVMACGNATSRLRDGERVVVDGETGVVSVIDA